MKTTVQDLTNEQLDRLCAEAQGLEGFAVVERYHPTTNDAQAMALLEELPPCNFYNGFAVRYPHDNKVSSNRMTGATRKEQICRMYIAWNFGKEVEVSE